MFGYAIQNGLSSGASDSRATVPASADPPPVGIRLPLHRVVCPSSRPDSRSHAPGSRRQATASAPSPRVSACTRPDHPSDRHPRDTSAHGLKQLKVSSLLLDPLNPRNPPVDAQDEAIKALIAEQGSKLIALMKDIAANGMSPADRLLVLQDGRRFVVLEGNRRIAALKILDNPDLAVGTAIARPAKRIARDRVVKTEKVDCAVAATREQVRPWIKLRHDGESDGAGTVRWGGRQRARFGSDSSSRHAQRAIYDNAAADDLTLGFATFFLNRTNRSGILSARPIGGLEQQGNWTLRPRQASRPGSLTRSVRLTSRGA